MSLAACGGSVWLPPALGGKEGPGNPRTSSCGLCYSLASLEPAGTMPRCVLVHIICVAGLHARPLSPPLLAASGSPAPLPGEVPLASLQGPASGPRHGSATAHCSGLKCWDSHTPVPFVLTSVGHRSSLGRPWVCAEGSHQQSSWPRDLAGHLAGHAAHSVCP